MKSEMPLWEAMLLGSTTTELKMGNWNHCALGAALNAIGAPEHSLTHSRRLVALNKWPWLERPLPPEMVYPICQHWLTYIVLYFDQVVCRTGNKRKSLEELIATIRKYETEYAKEETVVEPECELVS